MHGRAILRRRSRESDALREQAIALLAVSARSLLNGTTKSGIYYRRKQEVVALYRAIRAVSAVFDNNGIIFRTVEREMLKLRIRSLDILAFRLEGCYGLSRRDINYEFPNSL